MPLTLLVGGAGAGKSRLAASLAADRGGPVVVIATAEARDQEMAERIRRHRAARPADWTTVEEPVDLEGALASAPEDAVALVDCLTLWVSNLLERGLADEDVLDRAARAAALAASRSAGTIAVTNEVGSGVVPTNALARRYRDLLGRVNVLWAEAADQAALVVAGRIVPLSRPEAMDRG
ncbi:MAG TPA: bifunctional adenosylcobinamide kinase/adenosylcobinamide-phosphate guanylyltransferase [Actinomycetota bacterium]|nr:bifunctional adenosylcobinamide kinase/adenosylcobinamide-phosphate guanylyltransferase [Actinomycetota bacterium]